MKNKIFSLFGFAILSLLVLTSFASAAPSFSNVPSELSITSGSHSYNLTVADETDVTPTTFTITEGTKSFVVSATYTSATHTVNVSYTVPTDFMFNFEKSIKGDYSITLNASTATETTSQKLTFAKTDFCSFGGNTFDNTSDIQIDIKDIVVKSGFGEDEEWNLFDEIEVELEVKATASSDEDVEDISLEWGLFDKDSGKWVIEVDEEDEFDLEDGDKQTILLNFKLDDSLDLDLEELTSANLVLYVRAKGEVDDTLSTSTCDSQYTGSSDYSDDITLNVEDNFVILDNIQLSETASCGSQVQLTADVWNIGNDENEEEDVYVVVYNKELGLNQKVTIGNIDAFDNGKLDILVNVPQNAEEKTYTIEFSVYNEDGEVFQNDNDDYSKFTATLKVEGSCSTTPLVTVTADLKSEEVKAGQELIVKATIVNTGSVKKTFNFELSGYNEWATLVSMDKTSLELASQTAGDITITLKVNADASGEQTFNILAKDGTKALSQPVTVALESKPSLISAITGLVSGGKSNAYLWGIGALNVVLVLVIIFVAIKVVKKK